MNHPSVPHHNPNANVHSMEEWTSLSSSVTQLIVDCCCCNRDQLTTLDLSNWRELKGIEIGSISFQYVETVKIVGLNELESVVIGKNCFAYEQANGPKPNHRFTLKDCEKLKELKMGRWCFYEYAVCEIENNPSLEVIEMGEMGYESNVFHFASLTLNSNPQQIRVMNRLGCVAILPVW